MIVVHNEPPRCEDRRLIDAKFGLVMKVEMHSDRFFRSERACKIAQAEFDVAEIGARNGVDLDPADRSTISSIHQLPRGSDTTGMPNTRG